MHIKHLLFRSLQSYRSLRLMEPAHKFLKVDGSLYEGGGQMFRNSLALSTITGHPVSIEKIRAGRPNPGLNRQLQTGISIMGQISDSEVVGNQLKSQKLTYIPKDIKSGNFKGDCQTAGSIALMIQMTMPSLLFSKQKCQINLKGGTCVSKSPSVRYFEMILFPLLQKFGINASVKLIGEGFYPWGGGEAELVVEPLNGKVLQPINITKPGKIKKVYVQVITSIDDEAAANDYMKEIRKEVKKIMRTQYSEEEVDEIEITLDYHYSESLMRAGLKDRIKKAKKDKEKNYHPEKKGPKQIVYGILLFAYGDNIYYDCSCVCQDEITNDDVYVENVIETFRSYFKTGSCMDDHLQDQLLLFMLLASGKSELVCTKNVTDHTLSCFYIFQIFFPHFKYTITHEGELARIEIEGLAIAGKEDLMKKSETIVEKESETKENV